MATRITFSPECHEIGGCAGNTGWVLRFFRPRSGSFGPCVVTHEEVNHALNGATALAVSLVCLSGQAFAQQVSASATTSAVNEVGAQSGRSNDFAPSTLLYVVFGLVTVGIIVAANDDDGASD